MRTLEEIEKELDKVQKQLDELSIYSSKRSNLMRAELEAQKLILEWVMEE